MAKNAELDLVKIAPGSKPPVCMIINFGKYRYVQARRDMEAKKKENMQMVNECNNERFISFICSKIKAFKEKWKI